MKKLSLYLFLLLLMPAQSYAYCSEPSPPSSYSKPTKPSVPWCVNEFSRTHTCADWEIQSYYNDVENYNREVESYIRRLKDYVDDAGRYANCEIRSLN